MNENRPESDLERHLQNTRLSLEQAIMEAEDRGLQKRLLGLYRDVVLETSGVKGDD